MTKIFIGGKMIPKNPVKELIRCCSCYKYYDFKGNLFSGSEGIILICPQCGFKHKIDFKPFNDKVDNLTKIDKLDLYSAIDIGNAAIDRSSSYGGNYTMVEMANPANASGVITSIEVWANTPITNFRVATFSASGNVLTARDTVNIGSVTSGSKQTFSGLSLAVNEGDYLGAYWASSENKLEADLSGQPNGVWYHLDNQTACSELTFAVDSGYGMSLYGTGITVPDQVTGVSATDGTHIDKVVVTWNAASGATKYYVWTGASWIDVGNVVTYNHTTAPTPTITAGTASASDGTSADHVTLSIAGESANVGSSISYKVKAWNAAGDGAESAINAGYRGVGALTYQWQRSAADSDANYSNIDGATADPYNDTGAPADGSGRYYKCVENATGAAEQTTNSDRGYRIAVEVLNALFFGSNF